ncbi:MAG: hypothetical protein F6K36_26025 [Symploca sp. SIO3C6]|uniref:Peptidase C14 caspase domain-containing protein n=1 Tax=Symploca sp. SIO1C4 TaxID=2607765 RepID=A0A6B3N5W9_9CYAN|nr:hypothetical protein [Symploca sp. SIO3C6]NER26957.1 hypothetical protein [Symploca sp. SIO1C4]
MGIRLAEGNYIAVQVPDETTIDWNKWIYKPDLGTIVHKADSSSLEYNYLVFRVSRYYLLQHDVKPAKLAASALSAEVFTDALREIQSERLLVVIDSCHAAGMATSKDAEEIAQADAELLEEFEDFERTSPSKGVIDAIKQGKGRVVFTSSEGKEKSWVKDKSSSIYTYHFLEALQGAANQPGDTEVKVSNLMNHLSKAVPETASKLHGAEQTPHFDMDAGDFIIAKLRGGKGLPDKGWEEVKPEATQKINQIAQVINQYGKYIYNINEVSGGHFGDVIYKSDSKGDDESWLPWMK